MSETIAESTLPPASFFGGARGLILRLRILMFGHFMAMGAIAPILNLYLLRELQFAGWQAGLVVGMLPFGMILGCLVNASVTDRLIRAEHLYALLKVAASFAAIGLCFVREFPTVAVVFGLYALSFAPSGAVKEAVCLHHLPTERRNDFGTVRVFATFGWIIAGWIVPLFFGVFSRFTLHPSLYQWAFSLASVSALVNATVALSLPRRDMIQEPSGYRRTLFPAGMGSVFRSRPIILLTISTFAIGFLDRYFYFAMGPYLENLGISPSRVLPLMTVAQILEIPALFALGKLLNRWGFARVMSIGVTLQLIRFLFLTFGQDLFSASIGLILHGVAFGFYFVPALMCFDRLCPRKYLSSAYLLFMIIVGGTSGLSANYIGGFLFDTGKDFVWIWSAPLLFASIAFFLTIFGPKYLPNRAESA